MTADDTARRPDGMSPAELRTLFLLEGLDDEELAWFVEHGRLTRIKAGEYLTREGDPAECFYQLVEGTMAMVRRVGPVEVEVIRTDHKGAYGGATASWIKQADRPSTYVASVRAVTDATFLAVPAEGFAEFMHEHFPIAVHLLDGIAAGMRRTQERVGDQQRLQALGALSAGLTHELNNPASAAERAVDQLRTRVEHMRSKLDYLADGHIPADVLHELVNLQNEALALSETAPRRTALELSDAEDEVGDWLDEHGIERAFDLASIFVAAGLDVSWAEKVYRTLHEEDRQTGFAWVAYSLETDSLMREITDSVQRISQLVGAAKNYSQLDRAPFQRTDLREGLESTLVMLSGKLKGITVVKDIADDLPLVPGYPAELNQVWTNLIDNAAQATGPGGTITLHAAVEDQCALVVVQDDGPGVPDEIRSRIFEPFFTTKPVGSGTGLGLDISYRVVTNKHGGDIQVVSKPGDTRFEVRLPLTEPARDDLATTEH